MLKVMKFGGKSVRDRDGLIIAASIIERAYKSGDKVIAVLSAAGDTTDRLIEKAGGVTSSPDKRELDALLSTGEQANAALLAMLLIDHGIPAVSLTGTQAGIVTDGNFGDADILRVDKARILRELYAGRVVIVAGFQGVTGNGDVTTLGRGGSDTTAVRLASELCADGCILYKDVDGVFTGDPKSDRTARLYDRISYDGMLDLIDGGAKVLQRKSVETAKRFGTVIWVKPVTGDGDGTVIR